MDEATAATLRGLVEKGVMGPGGLTTDGVHATYGELSKKGVKFVYPPKEQPYGIETIVRDDSGTRSASCSAGNSGVNDSLQGKARALRPSVDFGRTMTGGSPPVAQTANMSTPALIVLARAARAGRHPTVHPPWPHGHCSSCNLLDDAAQRCPLG